ncbi:hypothetical protein CKY51_05070 [Xanthomonas maliensis]|nr:hypothetical protein CKY51_05070 [Xanthomonas maliensis]
MLTCTSVGLASRAAGFASRAANARRASISVLSADCSATVNLLRQSGSASERAEVVAAADSIMLWLASEMIASQVAVRFQFADGGRGSVAIVIAP